MVVAAATVQLPASRRTLSNMTAAREEGTLQIEKAWMIMNCARAPVRAGLRRSASLILLLTTDARVRLQFWRQGKNAKKERKVAILFLG